ncbi:GreA/GreB family elongation factor [Brevundimonas sp.]|uniref:GreA/GreB family elongation factor n=1 Tax=Brevundimonas sp. TaxID=1871086 RepID=UPI0028AF2C20|nr:GreA/GreB family elongation factor [Brevundimonas sp.]
MTKSTLPVRPDIFLSAQDHDTLSRLVGDMPGDGVAGMLQEELERAVICEPGDLPKGAVPLNRWLHYVDGRASDPRRIQIVLPSDADIDAGKVSVLSHVGAGLIGLIEGHTIAWTDPSGAARSLTPVMVEDPEILGGD